MSIKISVLLGGTSAERDVSMVTGIEITRALRQKGYEAVAIDCAYGAQIVEDLDQDTEGTIRVNPSEIDKKRPELDRNILDCMQYLIKEKFDVVFNALHGGYGENGQIQALMDLCGLPYTGSGSLSSALGMDKHLSKILFRENNIDIPAWYKLITDSDWTQDMLEDLRFPLVVKPNDQGSTVGLTIINDIDALPDAIHLAFQYSSSVILEKFIAGREITVVILDGKSLPVIEIIPESGIYDYESKYQKGITRYEVPAKISPEVTAKLNEYALKAYNALGCRHYARVDFRLRDNRVPFCLEVNTLPGMTSTSLVPKAAKSVGIDFPELVEKITLLAYNRPH